MNSGALFALGAPLLAALFDPSAAVAPSALAVVLPITPQTNSSSSMIRLSTVISGCFALAAAAVMLFVRFFFVCCCLDGGVTLDPPPPPARPIDAAAAAPSAAPEAAALAAAALVGLELVVGALLSGEATLVGDRCCWGLMRGAADADDDV